MIGVNFKQRAGFTLMEMVVAVSIFSLAMTAAVTIFVTSTQAQRRAGSLEKVDQQLKYLVEFFVTSLKQATVDYTNIPTSRYYLTSANQFNFINAAKVYTSWRLLTVGSLNVWQQCQRADRFCLGTDPAAGWSDLHSRDITLPVVVLIVNPIQSPWQINPTTGQYYNNQQPFVTLIAQAKKVNDSAPATVVQTTVTSRLYQR